MRPSPTTPFSDPAEDLRLLESAKTGNLQALDELVRRHQPWVFNLALRMVWRRETAEDATQEILLKAVTHLGTFAGRSKFSTWLYRIAVNHLLNVLKSEMEERSTPAQSGSPPLASSVVLGRCVGYGWFYYSWIRPHGRSRRKSPRRPPLIPRPRLSFSRSPRCDSPMARSSAA